MKRRLYIFIISFISLVLIVLLLLFTVKPNEHISKIKSNTDNNNNIVDKEKNEKEHDEIIEQDDYEDELPSKETYNNEDIIGYIKIDGTNIFDYIVQSSDNDYYLKHNLKKEYDIAGSVFMDYRNHIDDKKLLIFGHNAKRLETVPFHELEKFLDESFYKDNKYIHLKLGDEKSNWLIFSVRIVQKGNNTHMKLNFTNESFIKHIAYLKENALYDTRVDVGANDRILVLQTCNYNPEDTYILVSAKKV